MFSLILTFCTLTTCEEYVTDNSLTREDCYSTMRIERKKLNSMSSQQVYKSHIEQFKAEGMVDVDNGVMWGLTCVVAQGK